jgi:hypothetical protein
MTIDKYENFCYDFFSPKGGLMTRTNTAFMAIIETAINQSWPLANGNLRRNFSNTIRDFLSSTNPHFGRLIIALDASVELRSLSDNQLKERLAEIMKQAYEAIIKASRLGCLENILLLTTMVVRWGLTRPTRTLAEAGQIVQTALNQVWPYAYGDILKHTGESDFQSLYVTELIIGIIESPQLVSLSYDETLTVTINAMKTARHNIEMAESPVDLQALTAATITLLGSPSRSSDE